MVSVITKTSTRGYSVKKENLTQKQMKELKSELTVRKKFNPNFPVPEVVCNYIEKKNWIRIPKWYGIQKFGLPTVDNQRSHEIQLTFHGQLREHQIEFCEDIKRGLLANQMGIINILTGGGKTTMFLYILAQVVKQRAAILVHKSLLVEQWKQEIKKFLPSARVNVIQGKNKTFSEVYDITIIMLQTLQNIDDIPNIFGVTVADEVS